MSEKQDIHDCAEAMCDPCRERHDAEWRAKLAVAESALDWHKREASRFAALLTQEQAKVVDLSARLVAVEAVVEAAGVQVACCLCVCDACEDVHTAVRALSALPAPAMPAEPRCDCGQTDHEASCPCWRKL